MKAPGRAVALAAMLAAVGCAEADPRPQSILHIRTSLPADALDEVVVRMLREGAMTQQVRLERSEDLELGSLGLAPADDVDPGAPYEVHIAGMLDGVEVLAVRHRAPGFSLADSVHHFACLAESCVGTSSCAADEVCVPGGCAPAAWPTWSAPPGYWDECQLGGSGELPPRDREGDIDGPEGMPSFVARAIGGAGDQQTRAIAAAVDGSVIVAGTFTQQLDLAAATLSADGTDGFLARLDRDGAVQWAVQLGGAGDQIADGVAFDEDGKIWVTGHATERISVRRGADEVFAEDTDLPGDAFLLRVGAAGNPEQLRMLGGPGLQAARAVGVSGGAAVVVGTWDTPPVVDPGCALWLPDGDVTGDLDAFVWTSGRNSNCVRVQGLGGPGDDEGLALGSPVQLSSFVVAGRYRGAGWTAAGAGRALQLPDSDGDDGFLAYLAADGEVSRLVAIGGPGDDRIEAVQHQHGEAPGLLVMGTFSATDRLVEVGEVQHPIEVGAGQMLALTLDAADSAPRLVAAVDVPPDRIVTRGGRWTAAGGALLVATFRGVLDLGVGPALSSRDGTDDLVVVEFGPGGDAIEVTHLPGPGQDRALAATPDQGSGLLVVGEYEDTLSLPDGELPVAQGQDGFIYRAAASSDAP